MSPNSRRVASISLRAHSTRQFAYGTLTTPRKKYVLPFRSLPDIMQMTCFNKHSMNIADLIWSDNSSEVLSAAYDQTCKVWELDGSKMTESYDLEGSAKSVCWHHSSKNRVFFIWCLTGVKDSIFCYASSRGVIGVIDRKKGGVIMRIPNDQVLTSM